MKSRMDNAKQNEWFKEANKAKNKFVTKKERNAFITNSLRIYENQDFENIVIKNLELFSKLVKFETLINLVRYRIEIKTNDAKTMLRQLEKEESLE